MTIEAKIIADSINPDGKRITTVQCRYPRFIHSQVMTHRQFSRNAQSSRACPVEKMIEEIEKDPVMPIHWGANQKGMQADEECDNTVFSVNVSREEAWMISIGLALESAKAFSEAGYHKQIVNRLLEPFMHISVIITATEWDNFFKLRLHDDAQPEIQCLAQEIAQAMYDSEPVKLEWGEWHLPYSDLEIEGLYKAVVIENETFKDLERKEREKSLRQKQFKFCSVASCARVSYNNHDGSNRSVEKDVELHDMLLESKHMSPFEHQARAMRGGYANFNGWCSYRWELENGNRTNS